MQKENLLATVLFKLFI